MVTRKKNTIPDTFGMNATVKKIERIPKAKQRYEAGLLRYRKENVPDMYRRIRCRR